LENGVALHAAETGPVTAKCHLQAALVQFFPLAPDGFEVKWKGGVPGLGGDPANLGEIVEGRCIAHCAVWRVGFLSWVVV
jgi:hypothetical protein